MKKAAMMLLVAVSLVALMGCGSARVPSDGSLDGQQITDQPDSDQNGPSADDPDVKDDKDDNACEGSECSEAKTCTGADYCNVNCLAANGYFVTSTGWTSEEDPKNELSPSSYNDFVNEWEANGWCLVLEGDSDRNAFIHPLATQQEEEAYRLNRSEQFIFKMIKKYNLKHVRDYIAATNGEGILIYSNGSRVYGNGPSEQEETSPFTVVPSGTSCALHSVQFVGEDKGWIAGLCGTTTTDPGVVLHTEDGGDTWASQNINAQGLYDIFFVNENLGFAAGPKNMNKAAIYRTQDGGQSWTELNVGDGQFSPVTGVHFVDENVGVAVTLACNTGCGSILRTNDGGDTWTRVANCPFQSLYDVHFPTSQTGFAVGFYGEILKTTDGGLNWERKAEGLFDSIYLETVHFADAMTGFAVGLKGTNGPAAVIVTKDGGETWTEQPVGAQGLLNIFAITPEKAIAVGYDEIYSTTDGGTNWEYMNDGFSQDLLGSFFIDERKGFVVGSTGTIIKFEQ